MDGAIIDTSGKQPEGPFDHEAPRGVVVGPGAVLGPKAVVESGGKLGGGCMVLPLSTVLAGTRVPEGAVVEGSCVIGHHNDEPAHMSNPVKPPAKGGVLGWVAVLAKACFLGLGLPLLTHVVGLLVVCVSLYPPCLALAWALTSVRSNGLGLSATQGTACLGLVHVLFLLTLALLVAGHKWLIVGRLRAGRAFPLHGATYHRRRSGLVMQGLGGSSGLEDLAGSVLCPLYLRLLGANIDRHAGVYSMEVGDPDVLRVGEGAVLDDGAVLCPAAIDKGEPGQTCGLRLGPIWVRAGGRVGCGAVVMAGTEVGEGATVGDASLLPPNTVVEAGRTRCGVALAQDEDEEERAGPGSHCVSSLTIEVSA
jgi:carbonic anhydrase/acetyltransferase-like protein (isoleucine patch superfamily)